MGMTWSLTESTPYTAGDVLEGILWLNSGADVSATGYILGQLWEIGVGPITGSQFNLRWDGAADRAVVASGFEAPYRWTLPPMPIGGYGAEYPFRVAFERTGVRLQVWLLKMVGDAPDPDTDPILSILYTELTTPPSAIEQMMPMIGLVMMLGVLGSVMRRMTE